MLETDYRASRVCRILGNPTAYRVLKALLGVPKTPSRIARELGLSIFTVSFTLRGLRNVDLVRYEARGREKVYWIKEDVITTVCGSLETLVGRVRRKVW